MTLDSIQLTVLRWLVQGSELARAYWYLLLPMALGIALALVLRRRYWPPDSLALRWQGLLVDVSEQHDLIVLIHAARQDPAFRQEVLHLLNLPVEARLGLLRETLAAMRAGGAPQGFVEAIALLRDEHVVEETRKLLAGLD